LLRAPQSGPAPMAANPIAQAAAPVRVAVATPTTRQPTTRSPAVAAPSPTRIWLQLASGNAANLPAQFRRLASKDASLFEGISGYLAEEGGQARLVIGPFKSKGDADMFAEDLASVNIDAFAWTSRPGQQVRKLSSR
jgi:cell division protein FtsN